MDSDMNSRTECTVSKFADNSKLCGAVDTLEGRGAIQRDLGRLERWDCANLIEFNRAKWKVLLVGWGNPRHKYRLGRELIKSSPEKKELRFWLTESSTWPSNVPLHPRRPTVSWAASQALWPAGRGRWFCLSTPLWWDLTWSPALEPSAQERHGPVGAGSEEGHKNHQRAGTPLLQGKAERVGVVQPGEEKAPGRPSSLPVLKGGLQESWRGTFYKGL